ncbi:MAG: tRNA nucleotidyltransferase [Clostridia bacterium]|nr:tRNA nucleotidyltransferase [Clostridia bacterium]
MKFVLPQPVAEALTRLEEAGFAAYVVGGCVRDHALGMTPHDFDICTAALPEDMERVFQKERVIETGMRHGTLTVVLDGMPLEITTFRLDGEYLDGRHPVSVQFTDRVEEDLSRRDFTINAMAYSPARGLQDPFGGQADCASGIIRCVGAPEKRFHEDALRILRALRFSSRLGFPIEENTARAARGGRFMLDKISRERIAAELTGLLLGERAGATLAAFPDVLCAAVPLQTVTDAPEWPVTVKRVDTAPRDDALRWTALLWDLTGSAAREILKGLKMPTRLIETVGSLVDARSMPLRHENLQEALMRLGADRLYQLISAQASDQAARRPEMQADAQEHARALAKAVSRLIEENACYTLNQLAVGGRDMAALGLRGQAIGAALNALLLRVVRGETANERDALLSAAREAALNSQ